MKTFSGLTLIEVLIALAVLAIGVIAASSLQASGLRHTVTARTIQEVTNTARTEMELQRQLVRTNNGELTNQTCATTALPTGVTCTLVRVTPCRIASGILTCASSGSGTIVADQIVVRAVMVGPPARTVELTTVVQR
jgi:prepilin-type N-terminal cleavage/methylation domain-containing protein